MRPTTQFLAILVSAAGLVACGNDGSERTTAGSDVPTSDETSGDDPVSDRDPPGAAEPAGGAPTGASADLDPNQVYEFIGTVLEDASHGPELCLGGVAESYPPQCGGVPVAEWSWDGVPGAQSASGTNWVDLIRVVGTYDGETFTPTEPPAAADPPAGGPERDFEPLCDENVVDPGRTSPSDFDAAAAAADSLPHVAAVWVSYDGPPPVDDTGPPDSYTPDVLNVVVTEDAEGAEQALREHWGGWLCVEQRDQPTAVDLEEIQAALPEVLGTDVWSSTPDTQRGVVSAQVTVVTDELQAAADDHFGPGLVELQGSLNPVD